MIAAARARWHESISFGDRSPKYRPDGGAERFVSRALEALEQQDLDLNVITREWQVTPIPTGISTCATR